MSTTVDGRRLLESAPHYQARPLDRPVALAITAAETALYILDGNRVLYVALLDPGYPASVLAGQVGAGYEDGTGTRAGFYSPKGMVLAESLGSQGVLFVADFKAHRVRRIDVASGAVSSVAGYAWKPGTQDGTGTMARFQAPMALALSADDSQLFVTDYTAENIRVISLASAQVRTLTTTPPQTVGLALVSLPDPLGESRHGSRVQALYLASKGRVSRLVFPCSPGYYREGNGECYHCTAECGPGEIKLHECDSVNDIVCSSPPPARLPSYFAYQPKLMSDVVL